MSVPVVYPLGTAYAVAIATGGGAGTVTRTLDGSLVGVTDLHPASADHLRAMADAIDRARGRLPLGRSS